MRRKRRSIRLKNYDYSSQGMYFVTVCAKDRDNLFGEIVDEKMILNNLGMIVEREWNKTVEMRQGIGLDFFVIMPNHMHGIIIIRRGVLQYAPTINLKNDHANEFKSPSQTIGAIIRGFKSATTKQINIIRNTPGGAVWQRNFYDHIIRNEESLNEIRQYIHDNPLNWDKDRNNPGNSL